MEQGLALDELIEDQARRRGTKRVRWASIAVPRRCSMEGCCITPSSELSDDGSVVARREGDVPAEKLGSTAAAAEVLRRGHGRGHGVWWEANATHPWRGRGAVPHHRRKALIVEAWLHAGRVIFVRKSREVHQQPKSYDGSMIVGKEFGRRLTQPTPGAAAMLCRYRQNALTVIAGAGRVTCSRQR